jgi:hypothetical protein
MSERSEQQQGDSKASNREVLLAYTEIASDKIAAYRTTHYRVGAGKEAFTLRIDVLSDALRRLFGTSGQTCGLFITAFNPFGQLQSDEANEAAHSRLGDHLRALTPHVIEGVGGDPAGAWPKEKSYFALGIDNATARYLGATFCQDAVVWAGPDAIPQLLLLR